jgi:hypothetical protein
MGSTHVQPSRLPATVHGKSMPVGHSNIARLGLVTLLTFSRLKSNRRQSRHTVSQKRKAQNGKRPRPTSLQQRPPSSAAQAIARKTIKKGDRDEGKKRNSLQFKTRRLYINTPRPKLKSRAYVSNCGSRSNLTDVMRQRCEGFSTTVMSKLLLLSNQSIFSYQIAQRVPEVYQNL